jgi:hypothetical protein
MPQFGGDGLVPGLRGLKTTAITLTGGETWTISPGGSYHVMLGRSTFCQVLDPVSRIWLPFSKARQFDIHVDGTSTFRLANLSGCAVGAIVTNGGTGYTSTPTVTASAGGSIWRAVVGGAVSTTVTINNGGSGYTYPPTVIFDPPPAGGVQATGVATISGGAVTGIAMAAQGAGYQTAPNITFVNDPREGSNGTSVGSGAQATATLTGSGTVVSILCVDPGRPVLSVPTLTVSGGGGSGAAATPVMAFALSPQTVTNGWSGPGFTSLDGTSWPPAPAYTNFATQSLLVDFRPANVYFRTGPTSWIYDPGLHPAMPILGPATAVTGTVSSPVFVVGSVIDTNYIIPI